MGSDDEWPRPVSEEMLRARAAEALSEWTFFCPTHGRSNGRSADIHCAACKREAALLPAPRTYRNPEQNEILGTFNDRLSVPTGDGGNKRAAGTKPHWKVDTSHKAKMLGHLIRWLCGETVDKDSGAHPLDHVAWRALAIAHQETAAQQEGDPT